MRQIIVLMALAAALATASCASHRSAPQIDPLAQSLVPGSPDVVAAALIEEMAERQFALTRRAAHSLTFDRPIDNAALWPKLDGSPESLPRARVVMTLLPEGLSTRVTADMIIIAAPGTPDQRIVEVSSLGVDPRMNDVLRGAAASIVADRGTSDPRLAFAVAPIKY